MVWFWVIWVIIALLCFIFAAETAPHGSTRFVGAGLFYFSLVSILYLLFMFQAPIKGESSYLNLDEYETFRSDKLAIYVIGKDVVKSDDSWVYVNYQDTSRIKIKRIRQRNYFGRHIGNLYRIDVIEND